MADLGSAVDGGKQGASFGAVAGPWGALAGGVIGAGLGLLLGNEAEAERKRIAMEEVRRRDVSAAMTMGEATAAAGASGVELGGSMQTYLNTMAAEFRRQHDWAVGQASKAQSLGETTNLLGAVSGIGKSMFQFGANNNWWQAKGG